MSERVACYTHPEYHAGCPECERLRAEKEQRRLRLREKIIADPDVDTDAGILHPEAGVAERRDPPDYALCRRIGREARDATGRFAHLLLGTSTPPPEAVDEYVGLSVLSMLRGTGAEPTDYERGFDDGRRWAHEVITDDPLVEHAQKYLLDFIAYEPGTTMRPQREKAEAFVGFLVRGALRAGGPPEEEK